MPNSNSGSDKKNQSVGRRKEAVARVRVMEGNGQITVNGKPISESYGGPIYQKIYQKPFEVTKTLGKYTATVRVSGGGEMSQVKAISLGIARSLSKLVPDLRTAIKEQGLLTRDARAKERRKPGQAGKARAKKQSPKR